jgi:two-component system chemotaxis response regulator CheY
MNILIVDDSTIMRTVLKNTVSKHEDAKNFEFFTAENGKVGLEVLQQNKIDIMFLDWNMPVMTGDELVHKMREDKSFNKVRIIMATTEGAKQQVIKMAKKGVNGYLVKPFNHDSVMKAFDAVYARMPK